MTGKLFIFIGGSDEQNGDYMRAPGDRDQLLRLIATSDSD